MVMPISFILQQQDQEEVPVPVAEHSQRGGSRASEPEMERSSVPDHSPPSPTLPTSAAAPADTPGPSFTSQHSPEYVHASSREIAGVYMFFGRYPSSTGREVGSLSLHAAADHDTFGYSACSGSERGARSSSSIFRCIGSSSCCYRPTTTTTVRWLGFFYIYV